jgi:HSP20 family protein
MSRSGSIRRWYNVAMARRNPEVWFWQMGGDIQRLANEIGGVRRKVSRSFWEPRIDLMEDEEHLYLKVELAGVRGEDLQLLYLPDSHTMLIKGVRREEECFDIQRTGCHQLEIYYGEFEREVPLPDMPVEASQIKAQFRNGFLYALIPKAKAAFRHTKVSIRRV